MKLDQILPFFKKTKVSSVGNFLHAKFYYKTNDQRNFYIAEDGWHIINENNKFKDNEVLSNLQSMMLSGILKKDTQYNLLIHPTTITKTQGDHILITVGKPEYMITEENLERSKSDLIKFFSNSSINFEKLELELIQRPLKPNLLKSAYVRVHSKDITEEYISIPTKEECVVVHCSTSTKKNREHYKNIMFQIVDTIDLDV